MLDTIIRRLIPIFVALFAVLAVGAAQSQSGGLNKPWGSCVDRCRGGGGP